MQLLCIEMLFNLESLDVAMFGWWQSNPSQELPETNFLKVKESLFTINPAPI